MIISSYVEEAWSLDLVLNFYNTFRNYNQLYAFDRGLEKQADIKAVDYLINSNIDPEPFANFLYKLSNNEHEITQYLSWISTHPDSKERATYIIEYSSENQTDYEPIISTDTWKRLKEEIENL